MIQIRRIPSGLLFAVVALEITAARAFTDGNAVEPTSGGDGVGAVSGFTVSAIDYHLGAEAGLIEAVTFRLDPAPGVDPSVRVVLAGHDYPCVVDGAGFTCDTIDPPLAIADITEFRVIAAD